MQKNISILILALFGFFYTNAQTEDELVLKIREQFNTINSNLQSYETIEKDVYSESSEGGYMKAYHVDGVIVLLHCVFYGEMGNVTEDYYYWDGELFFVFTVNESYDKPVYIEDAQVISKEENRFYFNNDIMIRWLDIDKKKVDKNSQLFSDKAIEIRDEAARMIQVFNEN